MSESDLQKTDTSPEAGQTDSAHPMRRAGLTNFFAALRRINEASVADQVKQRFSDYVTIALVAICIFTLVGAVALPVPPNLKFLPLMFTVGAVIFYIINRLGIIIGLTPRQALIVWQILIASFWLGVTSAMLILMACFYYFYPHTKL